MEDTIEPELPPQSANEETVVEEVYQPDDYDLYLPIAMRKGVRECTRHPIQGYVNYGRLSPEFRAFTTHLDTKPRTIEEAMRIPEWRQVGLDAIAALESNGTWRIVNLPHGKQTIDCKWIFTIKYKADGSIERYKA